MLNQCSASVWLPTGSHTRRSLKIPTVKIGQIVYYIRSNNIEPMYIGWIGEGFWLFPMIKKNGKWILKKFVFNSLKNENRNTALWRQGFIGNAVDRDEFHITYAEAKWSKMRSRVSQKSIHKRYEMLMYFFCEMNEDGLNA